ncbi:MAG TPA: RNA polymerase sigma factor RpoH [Gammaproteobacteria bacterium]|nr:RNA polymerase sigma factor RpoH [Gammaproteobacteria bacterium]
MSTALVTRQNELMLTAPVGNLDAYINAVSAVPVLSADEESALAWRFRRDNDLDAARQLVLSHLRFVVHIARGYNGYGLQLGDLIQEGNIGLMKAVKRFDPAIGVRLVSFAVHWIRAEIHEFVLKNWRLMKIATTKAQRKLFFNLRKAKQRLGWLSAEETRVVADDLGVTPAEVNEMERRLASRDLSLDPAPHADDEERLGTPASYLPSPGADPAELVADADWEQNSFEALGTALADLDERSRDILRRRWLDDEKVTLQELADEYGVSAERIRQVEAAAMKKLRGLIDRAA